MLSANNMQKYFKIQFLCLHIARFKDVQILPTVGLSVGNKCFSFYSYTRESFEAMSISPPSEDRASCLVREYELDHVYLDRFSEEQIGESFDHIIIYLTSALNDVGRSLSSNDEKQLFLLLEAS